MRKGRGSLKITTYRTLAVCMFVTVGTAALTSIGLVGCGGDDSTGGGEGDASADQTNDVTGIDQISPDANTDAGDGAVDAAPDGKRDSAVDSGPVLTAAGYIPAISTALCQRINQCCLVDAGAWAEQACEQGYNGNPLAIGQEAPYLDAGVAFDPAKAAACIAEIQSFPCGLISAMKSITLQQDCFAALKGTVAVGASCVANAQCLSGNFCNVVDGGAGTCAPLAAIGSPCTSAAQCSYLGIGSPANYCDTASNTCLAQHAIDAGCTNYQQCVTNICKFPAQTCSDNYVFTDPGVTGGTCDTYTIKDAGGGG